MRDEKILDLDFFFFIWGKGVILHFKHKITQIYALAMLTNFLSFPKTASIKSKGLNLVHFGKRIQEATASNNMVLCSNHIILISIADQIS